MAIPSPAIILVRPEHPGNVGAVARAMANFSFTKLVLIDPGCDHTSEESRRRAKHAQHILDDAIIVDRLEKTGCDWLIATSAKLGNDENIPRLALAPREVAEKIMGAKKAIGIVFGPESSGLSNDEIRFCDSFVSIPTGTYGAMNLSHSVAIILYELFIAKQARPQAHTPMGAKDKEVLLSLFDESLDKMSFVTEDKRETQRLVWHRLIGKSFLTRREAFALMGFFKKIK